LPATKGEGKKLQRKKRKGREDKERNPIPDSLSFLPLLSRSVSRSQRSKLSQSRKEKKTRIKKKRRKRGRGTQGTSPYFTFSLLSMPLSHLIVGWGVKKKKKNLKRNKKRKAVRESDRLARPS